MTSAKSSSSEPDDNDDNEKENLTIAWIYKPPYIRGPDNSSLDNQAHGIVRDAILRYVWSDCSADRYEITNLRAESESGMIQMLKQNKVHIAIPIFEQQKSTKVLWIYLFQITGLSWYGIHSFGQRWKRRSWCRFRFCIEVLAIACCHHDHDLHGHCWNHHVGTVKIKFISTAVLWDKFERMVAKLKCSHISIYPYRSVSFKKFQGFLNRQNESRCCRQGALSWYQTRILSSCDLTQYTSLSWSTVRNVILPTPPPPPTH